MIANRTRSVKIARAGGANRIRPGRKKPRRSRQPGLRKQAIEESRWKVYACDAPSWVSSGSIMK